MLNFDERDLLTFAERAGFAEIHLELQIEMNARERQALAYLWAVKH